MLENQKLHVGCAIDLYDLFVLVAELSEVLWNMVLHLALTFKGGLGVVACFALFAFWAGGLSVAQHLVCMTCIVNSVPQPQQHLESAAIVQSNLGTNNSWHILRGQSQKTMVARQAQIFVTCVTADKILTHI